MSNENRVRSISLLPTTTIMSVHARVHHPALRTSFIGVDHPLSTDDAPIVQFRGIQYGSVAARFRQSKLVTSYPAVTDASRYGFVPLHLCERSTHTFFSPICPQIKYKSIEEEMFGCSLDDAPTQLFKQNEFECLNLNVTSPAGLGHESRLPVMVWIHGYVHRTPYRALPTRPHRLAGEAIGARARTGSTTAELSCIKASC
jgi:hypothetical protein